MGRRRKAEPVRTKNDRHQIRERLLAAGESLFASRGVHRTQVSHLAAEAGVSVGAFYRYFRDKDELYCDLIKARFDAYLTEIRALVSEIDELSVADRVALIKRIFRRSFEIHLADPQTFLLWYRHGYGVSDNTATVVAGFAAEVEALLLELLDRMITTGDSVPMGQRAVLATAMLGIANATTHKLIVDNDPEPTRALDNAVDVCARLMTAGLLGFASRERQLEIVAAYTGNPTTS